MSPHYGSLRVVVCAALAVAAAGCKPEQPYGVVEGQVTLDGKPLTDVEVIFMPDPEKGTTGRRSVALVDKAGRYRVTSDEGREGAPVGYHRVCIRDMLASNEPAAPRVVEPDDNPKGLAGTFAPPPQSSTKKKSRFPDAYKVANETPLRDVEVKDGAQVIDLALKFNAAR